MSVARIAFSDQMWRELALALESPDESAGIIGARAGQVGDDFQLFARTIHHIPVSAYSRRGPTGLSISSSGYVPALKLVQEDGSTAIFWHTHPGGRARPSEHDREVDRALRYLFADRTRSGYYGSLVLGGSPTDIQFEGSFWTDAASPMPISHIRFAGTKVGSLSSDLNTDRVAQEPFDRQVRAFGASGQRTLNGLRAAVVGLGGTGSAVAELLGRLGVGNLMLIDDDIVEPTNLTRIHGVSRRDVGKRKVDVVAQSIAALGLGTTISTIPSTVQHRDVVSRLAEVDVVFGCTDDHAGRAVLSRLSYAFLVPLIDMGFVVQRLDPGSVGLYGRVSVVGPGLACLVCRRRIDLERVRAQSLPSAERDRLLAEGYVIGSEAPNPSVVSYTTTVASLAVDELLDRLFGLGTADQHGEALLFLHDWRLSVNVASSMPGHYCVDPTFAGRGFTEPLLGQLWAE